MAVSRRRFLKAAIVVGALLATGSIVALVRTRGYVVPAHRAAAMTTLTPWQLVVVENVARRIVAPDRADAPTSDEVDVAAFVDSYMRSMHPALRRDLVRMLAYVEHLAPIGAGYSSRFTRLGATEQDAVLAAIEASDRDLLRGGFVALESLVFMGYYRDPRTWAAIGYDGPLVGRPEGGWR